MVCDILLCHNIEYHIISYRITYSRDFIKQHGRRNALTGGLGNVSPAPGSCGPGTKTNFADEASSGNLRISLQRESNLATAWATLSAANNRKNKIEGGGVGVGRGEWG